MRPHRPNGLIGGKRAKHTDSVSSATVVISHLVKVNVVIKKHTQAWVINSSVTLKNWVIILQITCAVGVWLVCWVH